MDTLKCKRCNNELEYRREGSYQGWFCKNCDCSIVTSYIPKIESDRTLYSIYVVEADLKNTNQIKAISKISGKNFLETRSLLLQDIKLIYHGRAVKIVEIKEILDSVNVKYNIMPEFNY